MPPQEDENLSTSKLNPSLNMESRLSIPLTPIYTNTYEYKMEDSKQVALYSTKNASAEKILSRAEVQREQATAALQRIQSIVAQGLGSNATETSNVPLEGIQRVSPGHFVLPGALGDRNQSVTPFSFTPQAPVVKKRSKESFSWSSPHQTGLTQKTSIMRKEALLPFSRLGTPSTNAMKTTDGPASGKLQAIHQIDGAASSASKRLSALQNRHHDLLKEVEVLEKTVVSAKAERKMAMENVESAEHTFLDIQRRIKELWMKLSEAESTHRDRVLQMEMERKELETRLEESRSQALERQQEVDTLQQRVEILKCECSDLESQLHDAKNSLIEANRQREALESFIKEAAACLDKKEKAVTEAQQSWETIEARCAEAEGRLIEASARLDAKRVLVEDAERRLQVVEERPLVKEEPRLNENSHHDKHCESGLSLAYDWLQNEFQSMREERDRLQEQLDIEREATQKAKRLGEEIEASLRTSTSTSRAIWEAERQGRLVAEERVAALESQLAGANAKIQELEKNTMSSLNTKDSPQLASPQPQLAHPWSVFALVAASCMLNARSSNSIHATGDGLESFSLQKEVSDMESLVLMLRRRFQKQNQLIHGLRLQVDTLKTALRVESTHKIFNRVLEEQNQIGVAIDQHECPSQPKSCLLSKLRRDKITKLTRSLLASNAFCAKYG